MSRLLVALAVSFGLSAAPAAARLTEKCNTNYGTGEVLIETDFDVRQKIIAAVRDPASDPDLFERLWQPGATRVIDLITTDDWLVLIYDRIQDTDEIYRAIDADTVLKGLSKWGSWNAIPNTTQVCFGANAVQAVTVTEYYNRMLDHYFMSSSAAENAAIDSGAAGPGWERTGESFPTIAPSFCASARPVFRFYGPQPNSHFFTSGTEECGFLRNRDPGWRYEGEAFGAYVPVGGICPGRTHPVYRLYNNGLGNGSNHRYVTRLDLYREMQDRGWTGEGLAMCSGNGSEHWQTP